MAKRKARAKTKTRTRTKVITKVRRVGRNAKKRVSKSKKSIVTQVTNFLPVVESVQLLSANQVTQAGDSMEQKAKAVMNSITGSLFDFNFFGDAPKAHFNPSIEGAFNQWSVANAGAIVQHCSFYRKHP